MTSQPVAADRAPAMTLAVALACGIAVDRWLSIDWTAWLLVCGLAFAVLIGCVLRDRMRLAAVAAVLLFVVLGGARHHLLWTLRPEDHIRPFADETPQLIEVVGVVRSPVEIIRTEPDQVSPGWMRIDRSRCLVAAESVIAGAAARPVCGLLQLEVSGHLLHARTGDRVRIIGELSTPGPVRNPGAFDYRAWLRGRSVDCILRCNHPDAVARMEPAGGWASFLGRMRDSLRSECVATLRSNLSPANAAVAASLLLGDRSAMTNEIRDAFAHSGTMHLLAISGLHVGLLAGMVFVSCRALKLSTTSAGIVVLTTIIAYAFVTDHRPPVIRAAILTGMVVVAQIGGRRAAPLNTLACAALAVLLWNPADLLDVGAQLSFLAVLGIISGARSAAAMHRHWTDPFARDRGRVERLCRRGGRRLLDAYLITAAIWLFTLPVTLHVFHIAAPIGFLLNVVLIPFTALLLAAGFLLLGCGLLLPEIAGLPAALLDTMLSGLAQIVSWSAATPAGHSYVSGPSVWWLVGWYALLSLATGLVQFRVRSLRVWQALGAWTVLGLASGLTGPARDGLTCTVLSVGHGGAVLLELPGGRTLVYDVGAFGSPERAERIVQNALWSAGISQVDGLIVSHADSDHYNGATGLMETTPVASLMLHRSALDFRQVGIEALCESAQRAGTQIALISQGDRLRVDPEVEIDVLHPPGGFADADDNANSIVLRVEYAGRSLLLTGDLEGAGLEALLQSPGEAVDVLVSPHHGAVEANPPELAAWCEPEVVIVSTGDRDDGRTLQEVYGANCRVLSTANEGAVTVQIASDGELIARGFIDGRR